MVHSLWHLHAVELITLYPGDWAFFFCFVLFFVLFDIKWIINCTIIYNSTVYGARITREYLWLSVWISLTVQTQIPSPPSATITHFVHVFFLQTWWEWGVQCSLWVNLGNGRIIYCICVKWAYATYNAPAFTPELGCMQLGTRGKVT